MSDHESATHQRPDEDREHDAEAVEDLEVEQDAEDVRGGTDRHGPMRTSY